MDFWIDGVCNTCESKVAEGPGKIKDYLNFCTNESCEHHIIHEVFDTEELDYYKHEAPYTPQRKINREFNILFEALND
jgi:hypothetical protein